MLSERSPQLSMRQYINTTLVDLEIFIPTTPAMIPGVEFDCEPVDFKLLDEPVEGSLDDTGLPLCDAVVDVGESIPSGVRTDPTCTEEATVEVFASVADRLESGVVAGVVVGIGAIPELEDTTSVFTSSFDVGVASAVTAACDMVDVEAAVEVVAARATGVVVACVWGSVVAGVVAAVVTVVVDSAAAAAVDVV